MIEIIPAILPKNKDDLDEKLQELPQGVGVVHIDMLKVDVWSEKAEKFDIEVHIMAKYPEDIAETWTKRGAKRIIVHELSPRILDMKGQIELGLGIEMTMPMEEVIELAPDVDFVQFMSIREIGEQGHAFEPEVFGRIKEFKDKFPQMPVSVDGGVSTENIQALKTAGADRVVSGTNFKELWSSQMKG